MSEQIPLTFQQEWLWTFLQRWTDWNCTLACGFRLIGALDVALLKQSIVGAIRNQSILRTRILACKAGAYQNIIEPDASIFQCVRVEGKSQAERQARAAVIYEEFSRSQFELTGEPLLRFKLVQLSEREHWILLAIHRLLVDCFSGTLVFDQIWPIYADLLKGKPAHSSSIAQYGDYAQKQRQSNAQWIDKHESYWQRRLDGATPLHWPGDAGINGTAHSVLRRSHRIFGAELSAGVKALAKRMRSLPGTVMLAIYVSVLWHWCRQDDFVLPFNVAGRQAEHRSTIGFFSHILYLRIQLSSADSFSELLRRVSNEFFQAMSHQDFGMTATKRPELMGEPSFNGSPRMRSQAPPHWGLS